MLYARLNWLIAVLFLFILLLPSTGTGTPLSLSDTTDVAMSVAISDTVVVTASRNAEQAQQSGRSVSVWSRDSIERLPAMTYDEVLRTVSGIDVQSRGGFGVQSDITMRGSTFNGVLVLVDGARLNDPMTGHFLADTPITASDIARIEVLRGPASALYGPDALGGVVQIFTHAGLQQESQAAPVDSEHASFSTRVGRHALYEATGHARIQRGSTLLTASFSTQGSDGQPISTPQSEPVTYNDERLRTDFERRVGSIAITQRLSSGTLMARAGADDRQFGAYQFYTSNETDRARESTSTYWAQTRYVSTPDRPTQFRAQVAAKQHEDSYRFTPDIPPNEHTSRLLTAHTQLQHDLSSQWRIGGGASGSLRDIDSNNLGSHTDESAGVFGRARWMPVESLTLSGSLRLDHDSAFDTELTPQFYAAWSRPSYTLRAGFGRAVRAPNYVERYYNTELDSPPDGSLGTPGLRAERAWSYEAGFDLFPIDGISLHATGFLRDTDGLIDFALEPDAEFFQSRNVLSVETLGLETELRARRALGTQSFLEATVAYTGLDATIGDVDEGVLYTYAASSARHHLQTTLQAQWSGLGASIQHQWKERLDAPEPADMQYQVANARVYYNTSIIGTQATASVEVRNVFDRSYSEVFNAPMPERWWLVGLSVDI